MYVGFCFFLNKLSKYESRYSKKFVSKFLEFKDNIKKYLNTQQLQKQQQQQSEIFYIKLGYILDQVSN